METMNILMTSSNELSVYIPALQASLYKNHEGINVHIFLMHSHIVPERIEKLKAFAESYNQTLSEIKVDADDFEFFGKIAPDKISRFTMTTYYPLLAAEYLPTNIERCLYLDIDVICDGNIYDWYCCDFDDMFFVACRRYGDDGNDYFWFNAGVYLINLSKLRNEKIGKNFYMCKCDEVVENNVKGLLASQGLLGYAFKDYENNGFKTNEDSGINYRLCWRLDCALGLKKMPKIKLIHYVTTFKPWLYVFDESFFNLYIGEQTVTTYNFSVLSPNTISLYSLFWKYAENAPFYNEIYNQALIATNELKKNAKLFTKNKKSELMLQALEFRENDESDSIIIPKAAFNNYNIVFSQTNEYIEYKTQYFIYDQWIIFPLRKSLKAGDKFSLTIDCEYKSDENLKLFLAATNCRIQRLPSISQTHYFCNETVNSDGYMFVCLWSNSLKNVGDYIRIFEMNAFVNDRSSFDFVPNIYKALKKLEEDSTKFEKLLFEQERMQKNILSLQEKIAELSNQNVQLEND